MTVSTSSPGSPQRLRRLITMPEIAELAGVHRPVVTTWRRRHPDFPGPVDGDATRPLFDGHQVADWLIRTGRADAEQAGIELSLHSLASLIAVLPARELIGIVTSLICLRYLDDGEPLADGTDDIPGQLSARAITLDPNDEYLESEIKGLPDDLAAALASEVDDLVEAAWGCVGAFERIMRERARLASADLLVDTVAPALSRLMAELCGARELARDNPSLVVTDLSAGAGDLLAAVATLLGPDHTPMFTGAEPNDYLARLARRRLLVHGVLPVDLDIRSGSDLPDDAGDPDVIVTHIPYLPGEERAPATVLAAIDDIASRLAPGRNAVVLGPADVLVAGLPAYSPAERIRTKLVADGMVEAVILLPGGLLPFRPGYQPALWVLSSSFSSPWTGRILLADVSDKPLTEDVISGLVEDVTTWRRDGYEPRAHTRQFSTQELVSDFVDPPVPLTSRRPRSILSAATSADERVSRIAEIETGLIRLDVAQGPAPRPIVSHVAAGALRAPESVRIGALARQKRLTLIKGARLRDADVAADGHHVVIGAEEVLGRRPPGEVSIDRGTLANRYPHARLTEPGDVIVTTSPALGALVDEAGFSVVAFPARAMRVSGTEPRRFTPRVLAALLNASDSDRRPAGAVRAAHRLEDLTLPMLTPGDLLRLDTLLARLEQDRQRVLQRLNLLTEFSQLATTGLADGTLTFTGDPA